MANNLLASDILELRLWTTDAEQAAVNTVHYLVTAVSIGTITDQQLADAMSAVMAAVMPPILANTAVYNGIQLKILNGSPAVSGVQSTVGHTVGTAGAIPLPRQAAGVISFYTGFAGPKGRGRIYLPFPAAADNQAQGVPTAGYMTRLNTFALGILPASKIWTVGVQTVTMTPSIYNRVTKTTTPITSSILRNEWATQKKRGSYGRANISPV